MHQGDFVCLLQPLYVPYVFCNTNPGARAPFIMEAVCAIPIVSPHSCLNTSSCCRHGRSPNF